MASAAGFYLLHQFHQLFVRDLAVDLDALVEAVDEGRVYRPTPIARGLQADAIMAACALAVGACNMHENLSCLCGSPSASRVRVRVRPGLWPAHWCVC